MFLEENNPFYRKVIFFQGVLINFEMILRINRGSQGRAVFKGLFKGLPGGVPVLFCLGFCEAKMIGKSG